MSQPKVEFSHAVVTGVVGPYGCEYLTNGVGVFLDQLLLDGLPLFRKKSGMDALDKNYEERNRVFNGFKVGGDFQPAAEAPPLALGVGVFLEDGGIKALGDCLMCSIIVSCYLNLYGRGSRQQSLIYGKCVR